MSNLNLYKFIVGSFASDVNFSFDTLQKVGDRRQMSNAVKYVSNMYASGGTALLLGIQESMKKFSQRSNVAKLFFLLTDGAPNNPWNFIHGEFERLNYVCHTLELCIILSVCHSIIQYVTYVFGNQGF